MFVFLLSFLPSTELWSSFFSSCFSLSHTSRTLEWYSEAWLLCMSALGQMTGDGLPGPAPGRESCPSVCLWVFFKRLALEDPRKMTFSLMKDDASRRSQ